MEYQVKTNANHVILD